MKSAYPAKKIGQVYECPIDGGLLEVTYAWKDGTAMMKHLDGVLCGRESCIGGQSIFNLVKDVESQVA